MGAGAARAVEATSGAAAGEADDGGRRRSEGGRRRRATGVYCGGGERIGAGGCGMRRKWMLMRHKGILVGPLFKTGAF